MNLTRIGSLKLLPMLLIVLLAAALLVLLPGGTQPAVGWATAVTGGLGDADNVIAFSMATYGSKLYVGTENIGGGCEVWSTDGVDWRIETGVIGAGFGDANNNTAMSMVEFNSRLYVGTYNNNGCEVWHYDGTTWSQTVGQGLPGTPTGPGFGDSSNKGVPSLFVYNSQLYAGTESLNGCEVWVNSGLIWSQVVGQGMPGTPTGPGFGNANNTQVRTMASFNGQLYAGTANSTNGCMLWAFDNITWTQEIGQGLPGTPTGPGFGNGNNMGLVSLATYDGRLFTGTYNPNGCEVWSNPGLIWSQEVGQGLPGTPTGPGFGDANNTWAVAMLVYDSQLFTGTFNSNGCALWARNGSAWRKMVGAGLPGNHAPGFGVPGNLMVRCLATLNSRIYAGTVNGSGCEVRFDRFSTTWYLAEGASTGGYETWILVQNPNVDPVDVEIFYQTATGEVAGPTASIPGTSRSSFLVNSTVQTFDVSTKVIASASVVCERAVYWTPPGSSVKEVGTDSIGVTNPNPTWYLAEGASTGGYETWILVQNPNDVEVYVNIGYYTDTGYVLGPLGNIPARSRETFRVNDTVESFNVSTAVWGTDNIICERAVYWTPPGSSNKVLGTDCIGVNDTANAWYLAEGASTGGYETWILVQNPGLNAADIDIRYQTDLGEVPGPTATIAAGTRQSFRVNDTVETYNVSTQVISSGGVICERSMYWTPPGLANKILGHDSVGVTAGWNEWYLAEGSTTGGYETWILVQNPGLAPVNIQIFYQTGTGQVAGPTATINGESRESFRVNDNVQTFDVSTKVVVVGAGYVICERAVYWTPEGAPFQVLGTNSIGWPDL